MTVVFMGNQSFPTYTASSTDIISNGIPGCSIIGGTVFLIDTAEWFILDSLMKLQEFVFPFQITVASTIDIGKVSINQPLTESVAISPYYAIKSVGTPGVGEPLLSSATYVVSVTIWPKTTNSNPIYIGTSAVDKDTSPQITIAAGGMPVGVDAPLGYKLNLNEWYVDAVTAGDGCYFIYIK